MTLKAITRFPGGNAAAVTITEREGLPEIRFISDPCGGPEALWFYFRLEETKPEPERHTKVRLTWTMIDQVHGGTESVCCHPVCASPGHTWTRLKQPDENRNEAGLRELSWLIPHPAPQTEIALCFPYGKPELDNLAERSRGFWQTAAVGLSQGGRLLERWYNDPGTTGGSHPGVYLVARQHGGETPGSWVLDGLMRHWASARKGGYVVWAVPLADPDGAEWGWFGREQVPWDMDRAWGQPPLRHEALGLQQDLERWKGRVKPLLVLDLQAPGAFERDGVYAYAAAEGTPTATEETKWCNVIRNELKADYAADTFQRVDQRPVRLAGTSLVEYVRATLGLPALTLSIPYAQAGEQMLTQKSYREIGQRIAQAIQRRNG